MGTLVIAVVLAGLGVLLFASPGAAQSLTRMVASANYDALIRRIAARRKIRPAILKAIVSQESGFDPNAINPEKSFTLGGRKWNQNDRAGRALLREHVLAGGDPRKLGVNPSLGLAQVRVGIARKVLPAGSITNGKELFNPEVNLDAAAALLAQLFRAGITLETIDAYNVGQDLIPRNLVYRNRVRAFAAKYEKDFA